MKSYSGCLESSREFPCRRRGSPWGSASEERSYSNLHESQHWGRSGAVLTDPFCNLRISSLKGRVPLIEYCLLHRTVHITSEEIIKSRIQAYLTSTTKKQTSPSRLAHPNRTIRGVNTLSSTFPNRSCVPSHERVTKYLRGTRKMDDVSWRKMAKYLFCDKLDGRRAKARKTHLEQNV